MKYEKTVLTAFLFFLVSVSAITAQNKNSIEGDFEALQDIYEVTDGDNWTNNTGWDSMTPETMGNAFGVSVNNDGRVTELVLVDNNLTNYVTNSNNNPVIGSDDKYQLIQGRELKESIGNLRQLKRLEIHMNRLTGEIPNSFYTLTNLKIAVLGYAWPDVSSNSNPYPAKDDYVGNKFSGRILPDISGLESIEKFYLDRNYFIGTPLPSEIGQLTKLKHLSLNSNGLNGELPSSLGNLVNLEDLHLTSGDPRSSRANRITTDETNSFTGNIPTEIGNLVQLQSLRLNEASYSGGIPQSFANLSKLRLLALSRSKLSIGFPNHLNNDNMPNLTTLLLYENNISGNIDPGYNGKNINVFDVHDNDLTGELPYSFTDPDHPNFNTKVIILNLHENNFTGNIASSIGGWFRPRNIRFQRNNFSGPLPSEFPITREGQTGVQFVLFSENGFTGDIPIGMGAMTSQRAFRISMNKNNLTGYETGAISEVIYDGDENYVSGMRGLGGLNVSDNDLPQGALDQMILDLWVNVQSRLGTEWVTWSERGANLDLSDQTTGAVPSYSNEVNAAIMGLTAAGWQVKYDGWEDDDRTVELPDTPALLSPSDQSTDLSQTPFFEWESTGAALYKLEVLESSSRDQVLVIDQPNTLYTPEEELDENKEYIWRVRAIEGDLQSDWSVARSFTTIANDNNDEGEEPGNGDDGARIFPESPVQLGPGDEDEGVSLNPEFSWSSVEGADYYILHMSRSNPSGMVIDVTVEDTTYTHPEILGDNSLHHWRVRAVKDGEPGDWSEGVWRFITTDGNHPEMPDLVSPDHYTENVSETPLLEWEETDADRFSIRIIDKVTSELILSDETDNSQYAFSNPLDIETAYIWQVKSIKNGMEGAWSPRWEFTTGEYDYVLPAPYLFSPNRNEENETLTPTFEWESVDADLYVISVTRENPSAAKVLSGSGNDATVILEEVPENVYTSGVTLEPETTYYWRVKGIKDSEEGEWSEIWEFRTPKENVNVSTYPGETPLTTELKQNYPNPFNPTTQIEFTLAELQNVSISVYNIAGQQVATLVDGVVQAGRHTALFDARSLSSGVYIYRFISDSHQYTKKMTLVK